MRGGSWLQPQETLRRAASLAPPPPPAPRTPDLEHLGWGREHLTRRAKNWGLDRGGSRGQVGMRSKVNVHFKAIIGPEERKGYVGASEYSETGGEERACLTASSGSRGGCSRRYNPPRLI